MTNFQITHANLILAWLWIALGFTSGAVLGFNFRFFSNDWQNGYDSLRRRLLRLGHIAFFGLAIINLMFHFTVATFAHSSQLVRISSWAFIVGTFTMPIFCFIMAFYPKLKNLFYIPVISLVTGGFLTFWEVITQ